MAQRDNCLCQPISNPSAAELSGQARFRYNELPPLSWGRRTGSPEIPSSLIFWDFWHLCIRQTSCKRSDSVSVFSVSSQPLTHLPPLLSFHPTSGQTDSTAALLHPTTAQSPGSYTDLCYRLTVWPLHILMLFIRFTIDKNLENPTGTLQGFINECLLSILYPKIKDSTMRNSSTAGSYPRNDISRSA